MKDKTYALLLGIVALSGAGHLYYSQTMAFAWDEGFHLLAAQSILRGRTPYLDFVFSQTPLNAYWNAAWMAVLGETWRVPHAVAAVGVTVAVFLMADYLWRRFPIPAWRPAAALFVALAVATNTLIVGFGSIAQAYALCLMLMMAAFRVSVLTVERKSLLFPFLAGLFSGAAADSSLLTTPAAPVMFVWMLVYNRAGKRITKAAAFAAGVILAFAPLLRLLVKAPKNVIFGVYEYNAVYRELRWPTATEHNIEVFLMWIDSSHALLLATLAVAGVVFVRRHAGWTRAQRGEFHLCLWMAVCLGLFISKAHPTFERYYMFLVPFLAVLAVTGLYWIATRFEVEGRPFRTVLMAAALLLLGLGKSLYYGRTDLNWNGFNAMVALVQKVTPPSGTLLADEHTYFLTRRTPPEGMDLEDSHKIDLPAATARRLHVVSEAELDRRIQSGEFDVIEYKTDEERFKKLNLLEMYRQQETFSDLEITVFWDKVEKAKQ